MKIDSQNVTNPDQKGKETWIPLIGLTLKYLEVRYKVAGGDNRTNCVGSDSMGLADPPYCCIYVESPAKDERRRSRWSYIESRALPAFPYSQLASSGRRSRGTFRINSHLYIHFVSLITCTTVVHTPLSSPNCHPYA